MVRVTGAVLEGWGVMRVDGLTIHGVLQMLFGQCWEILDYGLRTFVMICVHGTTVTN